MASKSGEFDFNHMASVAPRVIPIGAGNAMMVDPSDVGANGNLLW